MTEADIQVIFALLIMGLIVVVFNQLGRQLKKITTAMEKASSSLDAAEIIADNIREELEEFRRILKETAR